MSCKRVHPLKIHFILPVEKLLQLIVSSKQTPLSFLRIFVSLHQEIENILLIQNYFFIPKALDLTLVWPFNLTKLFKNFDWNFFDPSAKKQILSSLIRDFAKAFHNSNRESEIQMDFKKNKLQKVWHVGSTPAFRSPHFFQLFSS